MEEGQERPGERSDHNAGLTFAKVKGSNGGILSERVGNFNESKEVPWSQWGFLRPKTEERRSEESLTQQEAAVLALLFPVIYRQSLRNAQPLRECGVICQSVPSGTASPFMLPAVRDLRGVSSEPLQEETKERGDHFSGVTEIITVRVCLR